MSSVMLWSVLVIRTVRQKRILTSSAPRPHALWPPAHCKSFHTWLPQPLPVLLSYRWPDSRCHSAWTVPFQAWRSNIRCNLEMCRHQWQKLQTWSQKDSAADWRIRICSARLWESIGRPSWPDVLKRLCWGCLVRLQDGMRSSVHHRSESSTTTRAKTRRTVLDGYLLATSISYLWTLEVPSTKDVMSHAWMMLEGKMKSASPEAEAWPDPELRMFLAQHISTFLWKTKSSSYWLSVAGIETLLYSVSICSLPLSHDPLFAARLGAALITGPHCRHFTGRSVLRCSQRNALFPMPSARRWKQSICGCHPCESPSADRFSADGTGLARWWNPHEYREVFCMTTVFQNCESQHLPEANNVICDRKGSRSQGNYRISSSWRSWWPRFPALRSIT